MRSFYYEIKDEIGLHARPAGLIVKEAKKYKSKLILGVNGKMVEATKLMAIMSLGVKQGEVVEVTALGADEETACDGMRTFFEENL